MQYVLVFSLILISFLSQAKAQVKENAASSTTTITTPIQIKKESMFTPQRFIGLVSFFNSNFITPNRDEGNHYGMGESVLFDFAPAVNHVVWETGFSYRTMGGSFINGGQLTEVFNDGVTINYLSLPISAKWYFAGQRKSTPYFKVGLMGSTVVSKKEEAEAAPSSGPRFIDRIAPYEMATSTAVGGRFLLDRWASAFVEVNYNRGITSVVTNESIYNSGWGLTAGVGGEL